MTRTILILMMLASGCQPDGVTLRENVAVKDEPIHNSSYHCCSESGLVYWGMSRTMDPAVRLPDLPHDEGWWDCDLEIDGLRYFVRTMAGPEENQEMHL